MHIVFAKKESSFGVATDRSVWRRRTPGKQA